MMPVAEARVVRIVQVASGKSGHRRASVCPLLVPPALRPPVFLPIVRPATICQLFEKRLVAVNSTPLYSVSRYGSLSRMLFCSAVERRIEVVDRHRRRRQFGPVRDRSIVNGRVGAASARRGCARRSGRGWCGSRTSRRRACRASPGARRRRSPRPSTASRAIRVGIERRDAGEAPGTLVDLRRLEPAVAVRVGPRAVLRRRSTTG